MSNANEGRVRIRDYFEPVFTQEHNEPRFIQEHDDRRGFGDLQHLSEKEKTALLAKAFHDHYNLIARGNRAASHPKGN